MVWTKLVWASGSRPQSEPRVQCEHKQAWTNSHQHYSDSGGLQTATTGHFPSASLNCAVLNTWIFIGIYFAKPMGVTCLPFGCQGGSLGVTSLKIFITWHSPVFIRYKQMLSLKRFSLVHIKKARKTPRCLSVWLLRCVFSVYLFEVPRSPSLLSKRPLPELKVKSVWLDLTAVPGSPWLPTQVYQTCPWPSFLLLQKHIKCQAFQHRLKQALEKGPKKRY